MCNHNYMENVPVKIAENYKPPPRIYQLPQAIANRLALADNYYHDSPQFGYDFELERKVMAKLPEWQRVRQQEREARLERKQRREQQRLRNIEAQNKKLLGEVKYPDAEELSSVDSDEEEKTAMVANECPTVKEQITAASIRNSNFDHILQPIVLERAKAANNSSPSSCLTVMHNHKISNFDYKDFEFDTSSPFDNIELKTINDLDILAQVLHNTQQLKQTPMSTSVVDENATTAVVATTTTAEVLTDSSDQSQETEEHTPNTSSTIEPDITADNLVQHVVNLDILEKTKAALEKIDFNEFNDNFQVANKIDIPTNVNTHYSTLVETTTAMANDMPYASDYNDGCYSKQLQQHHNYIHAQNNPWNNHALSNMNLMYNANDCNGTVALPTNSYPMHVACQNANNYLHVTKVQALKNMGALENDFNLKSKSVPDILKELNDEVRKRNRNLSHNADNEEQLSHIKAEQPKNPNPKQRLLNRVEQTPSMYGAEMEANAQQLAKNISSMGFPIERVNKIMHIYGTDDKKIIEHLIPLSELIDLGFDETKISEALLKFNNNKEKALDYLIT